MKKPKYKSRYDIARELTEGRAEATVVTGVSLAVQAIDGMKATVDKGRQVNIELAKVKAKRIADKSASKAEKAERKAEKREKRKTIGEEHGFTQDEMAAARAAAS